MDRRQALRKALADILAGGIFIIFGLSFAVAAMVDYDIGTPLQMGPGFLPLLLGGMLVLLGVLVVGSGFVAEREEPLGTVPWRALVFLPIAFIFFGLTVRNLGVVGSLFITILLAALSSVRISFVTAVLIAAGLTVASMLIFIVGLQLRLPLFGPWLGFLGL